MAPSPRPTPRWRVGLLGALLLPLLGWGLLYDFGIHWPGFGTMDWIAYWSTARGLWLGVGYSPFEWLQAIQTQHGYTPIFLGGEPSLIWPAHNPPPLLLLLVPFGALGFSNSILTWMMVALVLPTLAAVQFNRRLSHPLPLPLLLWLLIFFTPSFAILIGGQILTVLVACLILAWLAQRKGHDAAVGVLLVPLLLKPHITVVSVTLLVAVAVRGRRWRTFGLAAVVVAGLVAAMFLLDPQWVTRWRGQATPFEWPTFAPLDALGAWLGLPAWAPLLGVPLGVAVGWYRYRHLDRVPPEALAESMILSYIFSPYAIHHELFLLLPAVLVVGSRLRQRGWTAALLVCAPFCPFLFTFTAARTWLYLALVLPLWLWAVRQGPMGRGATAPTHRPLAP